MLTSARKKKIAAVLAIVLLLRRWRRHRSRRGSFGVGCGSWDTSIKGLFTTWATSWKKKIHRPLPTFQDFIQSNFANWKNWWPQTHKTMIKMNGRVVGVSTPIRLVPTSTNYRPDYDWTCSVMTTGLWPNGIRRNHGHGSVHTEPTISDKMCSCVGFWW